MGNYPHTDNFRQFFPTNSYQALPADFFSTKIHAYIIVFQKYQKKVSFFDFYHVFGVYHVLKVFLVTFFNF